MLRKISVDNLKLDSLQIVEDSKCCLKVNAIITKVGVYDYSDFPVHHMGKDLTKALKSAPELLKATRTARAAKLVVLEHPSSSMPVVTSQGQMKGYVEKPFFDRDKIRAQLNFDKQECSEQFIEKVRGAADKSGEPLDVSIGFYHEVDPTSGVWKNAVTGQDEEYDYVMRNMVIDHVACGVPRGRCSFPSCGIGVDANINVDDAIRGVYIQTFGKSLRNTFAAVTVRLQKAVNAERWSSARNKASKPSSASTAKNGKYRATCSTRANGIRRRLKRGLTSIRVIVCQKKRTS
jgi:hypothetical protein